MAKKTKKKTQIDNSFIPEKYLSPIYLVVIAFLIVFFFKDAFFGGSFGASDNIASSSFDNFRKAAADAGEFPLWIPNIFSGMPAYESMLLTGERVWDFSARFIFSITEVFGQIFNSDVARVVSFYILYAFGIFWLVRVKGNDRVTAFFASTAAVFSTGIVIWIMIGHNTKPVVFAFLPYVFLSMEKLKDKFSILYFLMATVGIHLMFEGAHVQMLFYSACSFVIYYLVEIISASINKGNLKGYLRSAALLLLAGGIAFMMSSDRYLATLDYTEHSTRGSAPTLASEAEKEQNADGGNPYDYATQWSFSPSEIMTFVIPSYYGYGELELDPSDAKPGGFLSRLAPMVGNKFRTYWGQKPFEDAPPYMGILVLVFGLFGIFLNWKDNFVKFLAILSLFGLMLSFGYTLPILYDLFYYNVPLFNKFRAPSMSLALIHISFPILAAYGLNSLINIKKGQDKNTVFALVGAGGFLLLSGLIFKFLMDGSYQSWINTDHFMMYGRAVQQAGQGAVDTLMNEYKDWMFNIVSGDWLMIGFVSFLASLLMFLNWKGTINKQITVFGIIFLALFDLWTVGSRPMDPSEKQLSDNFPRLDWVDFIKQDQEVFRVAPFVLSGNVPAYYGLQSVNGYSSAKLRIYQDLLDVSSGGSTSNITDPFMWSLLNVKYIIDQREIPGFQTVYKSNTGAFVMRNPQYLPRAFFAGKVELESAENILKKFDRKNNAYFNPYEVAYVEEKVEKEITPPDSTNFTEITEYKNELIKLKTKSTGNNFLVMSEIYYAPGWEAFVDGEKTKIYKTNFAFRGIIVPDGEHDVEFRFKSSGFELGKNLSLAGNIFIILALFGGLYLERKRKEDGPEPTQEV